MIVVISFKKQKYSKCNGQRNCNSTKGFCFYFIGLRQLSRGGDSCGGYVGLLGSTVRGKCKTSYRLAAVNEAKETNRDRGEERAGMLPCDTTE